MKRSSLGAGSLIVLALAFIAIVLLANTLLRGARIDLTQNGLYTIAPGTERILAGIGEPIVLHFFFSDRLSREFPPLRTYGRQVQEFLEELAARSRGKVKLNVIDPAPYSDDEDRASEFGIRSAPLGATGAQFYFGLAGTNATDGKAVIEAFNPAKEQFLEYDVAKLIYELSNAKKPVVGWLSSLNMQGGFDPQTGQMREPWVVLSQAEQLFTVRQIAAGGSSIDKDIDVLVIVHPKELSPAMQFAIDQYALRGGRVLLFVDPNAEFDQSAAEPGNPMAQFGADRSSQLDALIKAWGVAFNNREAIGDLQYALQVGSAQGGPPTTHIGILGLQGASLAAGDVITATLGNINVSSAGAIAAAKGATTRFDPLLQTSAQAAPIPVERFQVLADPATLRDGFKSTGKRYTLAARITGTANSAFPGGAPPGVAVAPGDGVLKTSAKPLNVIVVADSDLLVDFLWVRTQNFFGQPVATAFANNGDFTWNAIENLAGSGDLISVRGRASFTRPFERVEALRRAAEDRFRATEQELERQLADTEQKLSALQSARNDKAEVLLSKEQEAELQRFQDEKLRIRKELRSVRLGLDEDIAALGNRVKLVNIAITPAVFATVALLVAAWRRRRHAAIAMLSRERSRGAAA